MRKYDSKNKRNIGIILGVCILFAVIFSYFLFQQIKLSKIKYELEASTVLFDIDKNSILLNSTGTIKKKWNKKYYLTYEDEQYNIGTHVIAFNNKEASLALYGEFYEINKSSEVDITKEETILNNLGISRFYKIEDRKYLIVDYNIKSEDESLKTTNYLIIELDRQGNAILYNNSLNVKVFSATKIMTSSFTFDIANELLIYDNETVDLKKILGTTNEYKEPEKTDKNENEGDGSGEGNGNGEGTGGGTGTGGNEGTTPGNNEGNATDNNQGNAGTGDNNNEQPGDDIITDEPGTDISDNEIINQTAYTSIIRITPYTNSISIDYVIYDKLNKYISTFVEIRSSNGYNKVYLSKSSTNISLTDLNPGTNYELTFKYTFMEDNLLKEEVIDTQDVTTLFPNITLTGTKVTSKKIGYKISSSSYSIDGAKLRLYINGEKQERELSINSSNLTGELSIVGLIFPSNSLVELRLEDVYVGGIKYNKSVSWSYKTPIIVDPEPTPDPEQPDNPEPPSEEETPDTPNEDDNGGEGQNNG